MLKKLDISGIREKISDGITELSSQWSYPGPGNEVPYKEVVALGLGGMGKECVTMLRDTIDITKINGTLLASTLGLKPMHIQWLSTIQKILDPVLFTARGKLVDNTRTKYGRFRPYIATMGFPLVILTSIFIFLPFETMTYSRMLMFTAMFGMLTAAIAPLYDSTYTGMMAVITPDSEERTKIITINSIILSFAPTITYAIVPLLSEYTGGYTDLRTYRYIFVPIGLIGVGLSLFTAIGTKERVIASKNYVQKVKIWQGCREIFKNKYWWIKNIATWFGVFETMNSMILQWLFIYDVQNMQIYALLDLIQGTAATIAMVLTPYLLKRFDNRGILLLHNALNIFFLTIMIFTFKLPYILFVVIYFNKMLDHLTLVYTPAQEAEFKDYQHYLSGRRMDFTFGVAGLVGTPITLLLGFVTPYIYEYMGITTNYDVLYSDMFRTRFFRVLCAMSIFGAALNLIPLFFYDLSREKHRNYIKVLRYRALFEDYEEGVMSPELIVETVEGARESLKFKDLPEPDVAAFKTAIAEATAMPRRNAAENALRTESLKKAKADYREAKKLLGQKAEMHIFLDEFYKFEKPQVLRQIEQAKKLIDMGIDKLKNLDRSVIDEAMKLPHVSKEEKKFRSKELQYAQSLVKMAADIKKNYPNGVIVPDHKKWETATKLLDDTKEQRILKNKAVKEAEAELSIYHDTMKPYLDAQKLLKDYETSKSIFSDIEAKYDSAKAEVDAKREKHERGIREKQEAKKANLEAVKQERKLKKNKK